MVDAAVYLRPARGGLMVGGFESEPLPVDPRRQPASFTTDDVPLDVGVLQLGDDALLSRGLWQYAHYYDPATA